MSRGLIGARRALNRYGIVRRWDGNNNPLNEWHVQPRGFSVCLATITLADGVPSGDIRQLIDAIELLTNRQVPPPGMRRARRRGKGGAS